jgi:hypothetical protein
MTGSKYTVILNTDEEGGFGSATDVIDTDITNDEINRNLNENRYRNVVASNVNNESTNHPTADEDDDDDNNNDDESFVTANTNTNMMTLSPTGQSHNGPFMSLSDAENEASSSSSFRLYNSICRTTFVADDVIKVYNIIFAENAFAIKLCKFTIFTFLSIWIMFYFVRFMVRQLCYTVTLRFAFHVSIHTPYEVMKWGSCIFIHRTRTNHFFFVSHQCNVTL